MNYDPSKHKVIIFKLDERGSHVWDENDQAVVETILEIASLEAAERKMRETCIAAGSLSAASLAPGIEYFEPDELAKYLRALNARARLAEEMPQDGTWIPGLTEDLDHWAEMGVRTPADLEEYLDGEFKRTMQKEAMCG